jgi:hypothetical protein
MLEKDGKPTKARPSSAENKKQIWTSFKIGKLVCPR